MAESDHFHGVEIPVRSIAGARAARVIHPPSQQIAEHEHDWPCLTLHQLGRYTEAFEGSEATIAGPCAVLHPARGAHANHISEFGLETISIIFDPAWLGSPLDLSKPRYWLGGPISANARQLAKLWNDQTATTSALLSATRSFLEIAIASDRAPRPPAWIARVGRAIDSGAQDASEVARKFDLNADELGRAYRYWVGEGLRETSRRRRLERAVALLHAGASIASAATEAGFCDQSHFNRECKTLLGRTPAALSRERNARA